MPELKNEIPTGQELYQYFMEHCSWLMEPAVQTENSSISEAYRLGCDRLLLKVGETIFESLQQLNNLSRTDPFWQNTNRRPTIFKLDEFGRFVMKTIPDDPQALWMLASLDVFHGATNFGGKHWKKLRELGDFDVSWAVLAGLWSEVNFGIGPQAMANLLREMESVAEAQALLELFAESKSDHIARWAKEVLALSIA